MSTVIKVISAFIAGVILSIGSALIYSRAHEMMYPIDVAQTAAAAQPASSAPQPQVTPQKIEDVAPPASDAHATPHRPPAPIADRKPMLHDDAIEARRTSQPRAATAPQPRNPTRTVPQNTTVYAIPILVPAASSGARTNAPDQVTNPAPAQPSQTPPITRSLTAPPYSPVGTLPQPHTVTLHAGTGLVVKLAQTLSSDRNSNGDIFRGTLDSPIIMNGFVIADKGSPVAGRVVYVKRAHLMSGTSDLTLQLNEINTTDGQRLAIRTAVWSLQGSKLRLQDTPKMAMGAAFGAVVGALSGAAKGAGLSDGFTGDGAPASGKNQRSVIIPVDTRLAFSLATPITITERLK